MYWNILSSTIPKNQQDLLDVLLRNRGIAKKDEEIFFHPPSPLDLSYTDVGIQESEVKKAIKLINKAKKEQWRVLVFGDYDADGVCATALLWETLFRNGVNVMPFIPHREKHGYGLSDAAVEEILADETTRPHLVITVDNGVVAHRAFARLQELGVRTILTDHHQPESQGFPPADVVIHTTQLCGTTVAWMLARAVDSKRAEIILDLCGVATIADQVPLIGPNRSFAQFGIEALRKTQRLGFKILFEIAGIEQSQIDTYLVNYGIAPRLNAMGRLGDAKDSLRLLCSTNQEKIQHLASSVQETNISRQDLTVRLVELARSQSVAWENEHIIIVDSIEYHDGVIGLIAGKLTEEFAKPSIVIHRGEHTAKASARSVAGVNITELIREVREDLLDVGGHPMAAGFSLLSENIDSVKAKLQALAKEKINTHLLQKQVTIDCEIPAQLAQEKTIQALKILEPHGMGNPQPTFMMRGLKILVKNTVGKQSQHLRLVLQSKDSHGTMKAIGFRMGEKEKEIQIGDKVDVVFQLKLNTWNGRTESQMIIKDIEQVPDGELHR